MSERFDHAAEAWRIIGEGEVAVRNLRAAHRLGDIVAADEYGAKANGCWAQAQVHATLALVEQQKIANRIAIAQFRVGVNDLPHMRHLAVELFGHDSLRPVAEIREALGL